MPNCVPEVSFTSSEIVEFVLIKPNQGDTDVALNATYSYLKRDKDEYFLNMVISGLKIVYDPRRTLNSDGHAFETLPIGTEVRLDGTAARDIPVGLDRAFRTSMVYFRGETAGHKVWLSEVDFSLLNDLVEKTANSETRDALVALGFLTPDTFEKVSMDKWRCPQ